MNLRLVSNCVGVHLRIVFHLRNLAKCYVGDESTLSIEENSGVDGFFFLQLPLPWSAMRLPASMRQLISVVHEMSLRSFLTYSAVTFLWP